MYMKKEKKILIKCSELFFPEKEVMKMKIEG